MANGDITSIKRLGTFTIPGGGRTTTGLAKNDKVITWGEITGTWVDTDGLKLTAKGGVAALGVDKADLVAFDVQTVNAVASSDEAIFTAALNRTTGNIMVVVDGLTNPTAADSCIVRYVVIGDSNAAPEQT